MTLCAALGALAVKLDFLEFETVVDYNVAAFVMVILFGVFFLSILLSYLPCCVRRARWNLDSMEASGTSTFIQLSYPLTHRWCRESHYPRGK